MRVIPRFLLLIFFFCRADGTLSAQTASRFPFHAVNYDITVTLHPSDQAIAARAKVELVAERPSRSLVVELHPDLKVNAVLDAAGKPLVFERSADTPLDLEVTLPEAVAAGKQITVQFDYAGPISSEEDSPTKGLRLAGVDKGSAYLLLPARWFPLTNYPANRYVAHFKLIVPDTFGVAGTGKSSIPSPQGVGQVAYTFVCDRAAPAGTFVAGALQLTPVKAQGLDISVFTSPAQVGTAQAYADSVARILSSFSADFGPIPDPNLTIAQMPDGSVPSFAAPGLLLIGAHQWTAKPDDQLLARLAAAQWWGNQVLPASPSDVWLSDGLAQYSGALYAEQTEGTSGLHRALEEFAVGALMYEDVAPIAQAQRLAAYSDPYRSIVMDKGAMVFHMLRAELGEKNFLALLRDFYSRYSGKTATLDDFEKMAEARMPAPSGGAPAINLVAFFSQWLNSTGVPEFKLDYIVYRTPKGFKVVGKIRQDLETFHMPVEIRVDTEGNPETKSVDVIGQSTEFEVDTFGRPKPNGITIDPDNNLLKSTPTLRVRAAIARGEGLAERAKFFEAIREYQHALDIQPDNALAHFRMGEAMFYQKNLQAAANEFRSALDGITEADTKWVIVWSHVDLGKIFDLTGQRERAVNEYSKAQELKDDTGGAQEEAAKYLSKPYTGSSSPPSASHP